MKLNYLLVQSSRVSLALLVPTKWKCHFPNYLNKQFNAPVLQWLLTVHFETLIALETMKNKDQGL